MRTSSQQQKRMPPPGSAPFTRQEIQHQIEQALAVLVTPGNVFEVRILGAKKHKNAVCAGYFDDIYKVAAAIRPYHGYHTRPHPQPGGFCVVVGAGWRLTLERSPDGEQLVFFGGDRAAAVADLARIGVEVEVQHG